MTDNVNTMPEFCKISRFTELTGMTRSRVYISIAEGNIRAVKCGRQTLIEFPSALAWLRGLPQAQIGAAKANGAAQ